MAEAAPNPGPRQGEVWRLVEAQHRVSTMKLVDDAEEQRTLEELLDASKPPVPAECQGLHYLLFTPFRYAASRESRFRRADATLGVFYAAERVQTAVAETAFWRLLFFAESPGTPWPANPLELTAFSVHYDAPLCLDLMAPPYAAREADWRHATDYAACHAVADEARSLGAVAIRSLSARDPSGVNLSILSCTAFVDRKPGRQHSWRLKLGVSGVFAVSDGAQAPLSFNRSSFARDTRIAALNWER